MAKKRNLMNQPKTILVVDDEADVLEIVSEMIADMGYRVKTALNGKAAQDVIASTPVDLVISDLNMKGVDGLALARWVRSHFPRLPLAMMTAFPTDDLKTLLHQKTVNRLLLKPLQMGELRGAVQNLTQPLKRATM
jgi:two-component system response regulator PilR (NtrC family)